MTSLRVKFLLAGDSIEGTTPEEDPSRRLVYWAPYTLPAAKRELGYVLVNYLKKVCEVNFEKALDIIFLTPKKKKFIPAEDQQLQTYLRALGWDLVHQQDAIDGSYYWEIHTHLEAENALTQVRRAWELHRFEYVRQFDAAKSGVKSREEFARWVMEEGYRLLGLMHQADLSSEFLFDDEHVRTEATRELRRIRGQLLHDEQGFVRLMMRLASIYIADQREQEWNDLADVAASFRPFDSNVFNYFQRLFQRHRLAAERSNVVLQIKNGAGINFHPGVDLEELAVVLNNLIGNAMKYRGGGKDKVEVTCEIDLEQNQIRITDNGIGMDPQFAAQLGSKRGMREMRADGVTGSGTGWFLIAQTLRKLGYSFNIETAVGKGTTVSVQLDEGDFVGDAL